MKGTYCIVEANSGLGWSSYDKAVAIAKARLRENPKQPLLILKLTANVRAVEPVIEVTPYEG